MDRIPGFGGLSSYDEAGLLVIRLRDRSRLDEARGQVRDLMTAGAPHHPEWAARAALAVGCSVVPVPPSGVVVSLDTVEAHSSAWVGETIQVVGKTTGRTEGTVSATCTQVDFLLAEGGGTDITLLCQGQAWYAKGAGGGLVERWPPG